MSNPTHAKGLTPAESLLLHEGRRFDWQRALEATLFDLVSRRVLALIEIASGSQRETYVVGGPEIRRHRPLDHELPFVARFREGRAHQEPLHDVLKRVEEQIGSRRALVRLLLRSPRLRACYRAPALEPFVRVGWKTPRGREAAQRLTAEIDEAGSALAEAAVLTLDVAHRLVHQLGGKVYLLDRAHELVFRGRSPLDVLLSRLVAESPDAAEGSSSVAPEDEGAAEAGAMAEAVTDVEDDGGDGSDGGDGGD